MQNKTDRFQLKPTKVDEKYQFNFHTFNPKVEGVLVLFSLVVLPLISIIFLNIFKKSLNLDSDKMGLIINILTLIFSTIGGIIFW
ncbi:Uncharacterised protein, partial [Mycoplasma putrefaciens]